MLEGVAGSINPFLVAGALFSALAAILHFAGIFWGAAGYRVLGAGEPIVRMAQAGHWYPSFIACAVGAVLLTCALFALSGAGVIAQLPWARAVLVVITAVFLVRALFYPLLKPLFPGNSETFWRVTSGVCFVIGTAHLIGLYQVWDAF
jgi:hypothetical protein